jgi:hypothetical protein
MDSEEDYEFPMETTFGKKTVIISKSALRILGGLGHEKPAGAVAIHELKLTGLVEGKLAKSGNRDSIRLTGVDLNGLVIPRS